MSGEAMSPRVWVATLNRAATLTLPSRDSIVEAALELVRG